MSIWKYREGSREVRNKGFICGENGISRSAGKPYQIEISIGCARLEPDIATVHDLIDKADQEMYHLKTRKHGTAPAEKQG